MSERYDQGSKTRRKVLGDAVPIGSMLHPSPASPAEIV